MNEKRKDDEKQGRSDETLEKFERSGLYAVRGVITITFERLAWVADVRVRRSLTASILSGLV